MAMGFSPYYDRQGIRGVVLSHYVNVPSIDVQWVVSCEAIINYKAVYYLNHSPTLYHNWRYCGRYRLTLNMA